jgi:hypothetical protein
VTVPTSPGAGQVASARAYILRVTEELPPRRAVSREFLILIGHASALLAAIDAGAIARDMPEPGAITREMPEAGARRTLAKVILADFDREASEFAAGGPQVDWVAWSHRLAHALGGLLDAIGGR